MHWTLSDQTLDLTLGPLTAAGRLALFRGRRMMVAEGGATRAEVVPAPQPILQLVLVPTAKGELLVGRTKDGLLRFEDPLGAGSWIAAGLKCDPGFHVGAIPGAVIVWCRGKVPWLLDVETGASRPSPFPNDFPVIDAAFLNDKDGAAVFTLRGLVVTRDGGASWSAPKTLGNPLDALYVNTVRVERGRAWAAQSTLGEESRATLDVAGATLGALAGPPFQGVGGPEAEILAPFRKWVELLRDPLESAAALGVEAPGGGAWVVAGDQVVRVELGTGHASLVARLKGRSAEREHLGRGGRIARSGSDVWILSTERKVVHGTVDGSTLALDEPQILPASASQIRVSRSGGVMALGDERDRASPASVRQPDGSWKSFRPAEPGSIDGAGPLADGRFAFVKGLVATGKGGGPRVARVSPTGAVEEGPLLPLPSRDHLLVASSLEEDAEHVIRFALKDAEGPLVIVVPADGSPPRVTRVPGATMAGLHGGRGIAVGVGKLFVSLDGGDTWKREATPTRAIAELTGAVPEVSDVGARIGNALRVGWGRAEPPAEDPPRPVARGGDGGPPLRVAGKRHVLSCRSTGKAASVAAPSSTVDVQQSLGAPPDPPESIQRVVNWGGGVAGAAEDDWLESSGMWLEESDSGNDGHRPMKWELRWIESHGESGAGSAPGTGSRGSRSRGASTRGAPRSPSSARGPTTRCSGSPWRTSRWRTPSRRSCSRASTAGAPPRSRRCPPPSWGRSSPPSRSALARRRPSSGSTASKCTSGSGARRPGPSRGCRPPSPRWT